MIILTILICWIMLLKWQVRHIHNRGEFMYNALYKYGDVITWNGYLATVIDPKTTDMVIKRHLIGLICKQPLINPSDCGKVE